MTAEINLKVNGMDWRIGKEGMKTRLLGVSLKNQHNKDLTKILIYV